MQTIASMHNRGPLVQWFWDTGLLPSLLVIAASTVAILTLAALIKAIFSKKD